MPSPSPPSAPGVYPMLISEKIKLISSVAGIIGVIIALVGLVLSVQSLSREYARIAQAAEENRIGAWQQSVVFDLIRKNDTADGVAFSDLSDKYAVAGFKDIPSDIPREKLSERQLKKVLLELITRRAIEPIGTDSYTVVMMSKLPDPRAAMEEYDQKMSQLIEIVRRESGNYDRNKLMDIIASEMRVPRRTADFMLLQLQSHPMLELTPNGQGKVTLEEKETGVIRIPMMPNSSVSPGGR